MSSTKKLKENTKVIYAKDTVTAISTVNDPFFVDNTWVDRHTFVGVARLKENDVCDLITAEHIALSKLERNFHNIMKNTYNQIVREEEKDIVLLKEEVNKHIKASKSITNHITNLSNKTKH